MDRPLAPFPVLCDLDGVVWLSGAAIPGAAEAVAELRARGHRVVFVTNNSSPTLADYHDALAAIGIAAEGDVLTSAMAAAGLVHPGERVLVCGGEGIVEAVGGRGAEVLRADASSDPAGAVDAVVVGITSAFDYALLDRASAAVRAGARLIGTNDDATHPTASGVRPGGGAILAAVAVAGGAVPTVAGKPYEPMVALARSALGGAVTAGAVMVGDRAETDGLFARALGCRFALVDTGVTAPGTSVDPAPDVRDADLAAVVRGLLAG